MPGIGGGKKRSGYRPAKHHGIDGWDHWLAAPVRPDDADVLANILGKQGWSGPMEELDDDAFDQFAATSPAVVYRGVKPDHGKTAEVLNREFLDDDDPYIGDGVNGHGWYTTDRLGTANRYAGAASRSTKRDNSDRSTVGKAVLEMAFRPEADILEVTRAKDRRPMLGEHSAQLGYDAVAVPGAAPGETYYLLLNRSAVVARRMR